ncbi:calmodulin-like protein 4 [Pholidichthys leucotaenia]
MTVVETLILGELAATYGGECSDNLVPQMQRINASELTREEIAGARKHGLNMMDPAKFLTQDQINEFKECFSLYDRQRKGKIEARDLITVMRCLGSSPTPSEVQRHLLSHNLAHEKSELDFSTFLSVMHRQLQQEAPEEEILEALRMADKDQKGFILESELRAKLTGLGEKLTHKEVDELLKDAGVGGDGRVHCEQFAKAVAHGPSKR